MEMRASTNLMDVAVGRQVHVIGLGGTFEVVDLNLGFIDRDNMMKIKIPDNIVAPCEDEVSFWIKSEAFGDVLVPDDIPKEPGMYNDRDGDRYLITTSGVVYNDCGMVATLEHEYAPYTAI